MIAGQQLKLNMTYEKNKSSESKTGVWSVVISIQLSTIYTVVDLSNSGHPSKYLQTSVNLHVCLLPP